MADNYFTEIGVEDVIKLYNTPNKDVVIFTIQEDKTSLIPSDETTSNILFEQQPLCLYKAYTDEIIPNHLLSVLLAFDSEKNIGVPFVHYNDDIFQYCIYNNVIILKNGLVILFAPKTKRISHSTVLFEKNIAEDINLEYSELLPELFNNVNTETQMNRAIEKFLKTLKKKK